MTANYKFKFSYSNVNTGVPCIYIWTGSVASFSHTQNVCAKWTVHFISRICKTFSRFMDHFRVQFWTCVDLGSITFSLCHLTCFSSLQMKFPSFFSAWHVNLCFPLMIVLKYRRNKDERTSWTGKKNISQTVPFLDWRSSHLAHLSISVSIWQDETESLCEAAVSLKLGGAVPRYCFPGRPRNFQFLLPLLYVCSSLPQILSLTIWDSTSAMSVLYWMSRVYFTWASFSLAFRRH